jgi:hypothetical protein
VPRAPVRARREKRMVLAKPPCNSRAPIFSLSNAPDRVRRGCTQEPQRGGDRGLEVEEHDPVCQGHRVGTGSKRGAKGGAQPSAAGRGSRSIHVDAGVQDGAPRRRGGARSRGVLVAGVLRVWPRCLGESTHEVKVLLHGVWSRRPRGYECGEGADATVHPSNRRGSSLWRQPGEGPDEAGTEGREVSDQGLEAQGSKKPRPSGRGWFIPPDRRSRTPCGAGVAPGASGAAAPRA